MSPYEELVTLGQLEQEKPGDGNIGIDEEVVRDLLDGEGLGQK